MVIERSGSLRLFQDASNNQIALFCPEGAQPKIFSANWAPLVESLMESPQGKLAKAFLWCGLPSRLVSERELNVNGEPYLLLAEDWGSPVTTLVVEKGEFRDYATFMTFEPERMRQWQYTFVPRHGDSFERPRLALELLFDSSRAFSDSFPYQFWIQASCSESTSSAQRPRRERRVIFNEVGKIIRETYLTEITVGSLDFDWGNSFLNQAAVVCLKMEADSESGILISFTAPGWPEDACFALYATGHVAADNDYLLFGLQSKADGLNPETIALFNRLLTYYGPEFIPGKQILCC